MNLHINVIRGCCVHGYFQQRGWEDVKHAKPLCIYANWAPFSNLNTNLAETNSFLTCEGGPKCLCAQAHTAAHTSSGTSPPCSWVRSEMNGCTLGHVKSQDSRWFCCLILRSRDTANIAVISGGGAGGRAQHTISVQMQISDSGASAKEVTLSQIIRA